MQPSNAFQTSRTLPANAQIVFGASANALRVMIVEDEAIIAALLAEVLEGMGHDVCTIEATESAAVSAAAHHRPDIMIVDARLGEGSGIAAVEQILHAGFVPHILVSGDSLGVRLRRPRSIVLQKPFRELDLARAIHQAMQLDS